MKLRVTGLFMASMLCTTAVAPALAQQGQQECERLDQLIQENDQFQQVWLDEAAAAAARDDAQLCAYYVAQAEQTLAQGEEVERVEGRIVVTQEPPRVDVEQPAPDISVTQPEPQVSVAQPQPEIIVRQVPPTIRIEMPEPVVTIDQPQPEIIVRMPDPQVSVETPEAQVQVDQEQPRVTVEQGEPEVDLAVEDTPAQNDQQQADVQVQQGTPQVRLQQQEGDQAQVDLQQTQPRVTYEAAEPRIEFSGGGEPRVQFTESGEPNVSFADEDVASQQQTQQQQTQPEAGEQQASPQPGTQQQTDQQPGAQQQAAGTADGQDDAWRGGRQAMTAPQAQLPGYEPVDRSTLSVDNLMGANVFGATGNNIGNLQDVVASEDGQVEFVVLDIGGFLGIGAHQIALGLDEVSVLRDGANNLRVHVDATREQLEQMPGYPD